MHSAFATAPAGSDIPITFATKATWEAVCASLPGEARQFALANGFTAKPGACLTLPGADGKIAHVVFGLDEETSKTRDPFRTGQLPALLPPGVYRFGNAPHDTRLATLAFALGSYRFSRYRKADAPDVRLLPSEGIDLAAISRAAEAATLARDLINTPSNDMGPEELALAAQQLAERFGAAFNCIIGEDLRHQNFPLIHAVGMASSRAPRLIDLSWGDRAHPKVTLVGKGVCFDTGGLDLKPSAGMLIMKKDMGGAANVLALAHLVMAAKLKVRLRVLIPAVENAISGNAFRPLDIFQSRKGITVEIGNTDAEGRLVLADALALACEEKPDLLIDLGTLTGAARVALGPDLPPFYTDDEKLALDLARCAMEENDPVWRLPLWPGYDAWLDSKVADVNNAPSSTFAGSITCALSCSALSPTRKAGCMSISTAGRRRPSRRVPKAANARPRAPSLDCSENAMDDPRLTPARPDLAAKHLEGKVKAARFVEGQEFDISDAIAPMRERPSVDAVLLTQALKGERVTIYERNSEGFAWGQLNNDGYVGWLPDRALASPGGKPTHKITSLRTFAFPGPSIKLPPAETLVMGNLITVIDKDSLFAVTREGWHISRAHVGSIDRYAEDFVAVAESLIGTPYLWGGKSSLGADCSGLVQLSLNAAGIPCPRDSDMQQNAFGKTLGLETSKLQRGDLIFWKGHVAIVRDAESIVHANAHHMATVIENTCSAIGRIKADGSEIAAIKRLS